MKTDENRALLRQATTRMAIGALLLLSMVVMGVATVRAAEIIPSIGITRAVDDNSSDAAKTFGGLAVRGNLLPMLKSEVGIAYRRESYFDDNLQVKMWPVTGSLWLSPIPTLYAGGGVGWYQTTFDYDSSLPFQDETTQKFGVHLGGGLDIPLAPRASLDLNGRYVFMKEETSQLPPNKFDPDFWTTSVGLGIHF